MEKKSEHGRLSPKQVAFLSAYVRVGTVSGASEASRTARTCHYEWLAKSPEYVEAFAAAEERAIETLEAEARRRKQEAEYFGELNLHRTA